MSAKGLDLNDLLRRGLLPPDLFAVAEPFNKRASRARRSQRTRGDAVIHVDASLAEGRKL